ncbi:MAG: hypothetical protein U9Q83_07795 [Bacteroidota bacterium]|nr:hypothetical protein [Bacteroidota bacterium]
MTSKKTHFVKFVYFRSGTNYKVFEESEYLHNSFKKLKDETLKYTNRQGKRKSQRITQITDLYSIIENTIKIA